jgi:hypothetical protein
MVRMVKILSRSQLITRLGAIFLEVLPKNQQVSRFIRLWMRAISIIITSGG